MHMQNFHGNNLLKQELFNKTMYNYNRNHLLKYRYFTKIMPMHNSNRISLLRDEQYAKMTLTNTISIGNICKNFY